MMRALDRRACGRPARPVRRLPCLARAAAVRSLRRAVRPAPAALPQLRHSGCPPGLSQCGSCLGARPPLDACHAAVSYEYPWSALIAHYKFNGEAGWARCLATLMRSAPWVEPALEEADVVVPMPLSGQRLAERGFNQALLLARALAPAKTDARLLLRVRHTAAQAALDRKERLAQRERRVRGRSVAGVASARQARRCSSTTS